MVQGSQGCLFLGPWDSGDPSSSWGHLCRPVDMGHHKERDSGAEKQLEWILCTNETANNPPPAQACTVNAVRPSSWPEASFSPTPRPGHLSPSSGPGSKSSLPRPCALGCSFYHPALTVCQARCWRFTPSKPLVLLLQL